jgi:hypothetical protein
VPAHAPANAPANAPADVPASSSRPGASQASRSLPLDPAGDLWAVSAHRRPRQWARRPGVRPIAWGVGAAVLAAAALGVVLGSPGEGSGAQAVVIDAAGVSLAARTAGVSAVGSIRSGGLTEGYSMTGSVNFVSDADSLTGTETEADEQLELHVVSLGGLTYEEFPEIARVDPGKNWVSLDPASVAALSQGSSAGGPAGDLGVWLQVLTGHANSVRALGSSTVGGSPVRRYAVTFPPAVIDAAIRQAGVDGSSSAAALSVTHADATVSVDVAGRLTREAISIVENAGPASPKASVRATTIRTVFAFDHFGRPVSIQPPPAGQVIPFTTFLQLSSAGVQTVAARTP